jgi:creatinine amidohydrolase/Fe(II)-dependent formamide hydrolase-like protein
MPAFRIRFRLPLPQAKIAIGALALLCAVGFAIERPLTAPLSPKLEIADLTWVEVRTAIEHGFTTALVPSGGLEQNGPHMIIGKHDHIVQAAARRIAEKLGRTLVTPVVSYVPQGGYDPPTGNMQFPGTLGVTEEVFAGTLEGIARSLKAAGFKTICFIADHGGSAKPQAEVARRLTDEWRSQRVRVLDVNAYYDADAAQRVWLMAQGESAGAIGRHAGIQDTSELMAVHPQGVDLTRYAAVGLRSENSGVSGDPLRASAERGRALLALKVDAAVAQIGAALKEGIESAAR